MTTELFTIEELQDQLRRLQEARRSGAKRVEFRERTVEYKNDSEMATAIADLERRLGGAGPHAIVIRSTKGW